MFSKKPVYRYLSFFKAIKLLTFVEYEYTSIPYFADPIKPSGRFGSTPPTGRLAGRSFRVYTGKISRHLGSFFNSLTRDSKLPCVLLNHATLLSFLYNHADGEYLKWERNKRYNLNHCLFCICSLFLRLKMFGSHQLYARYFVVFVYLRIRLHFLPASTEAHINPELISHSSIASFLTCVIFSSCFAIICSQY